MERIQRDTHLPENDVPPSPQPVTAAPSSNSPANRAEPTGSITNDSTTGLAPKHHRVLSESSPAQRYQGPFSKECDVSNTQNPATIVSDNALKAVFSEDEGLYVLATKLIQLLHTVQKKADLHHRLHLFVESDRRFTGGVPEGHSEVMHRVQTRLAFSPTLSASELQQQSGLSRLHGELTHLSFQKAPSGSSYVSDVSTTVERITPRPQSRPRPMPFTLDTGNPQVSEPNRNKARELQWPEPITTEFHKNFPKWCPFTPKNGESGYTSPPQNSKDYHLLLEKDAVELFKRFKDFQVMWIYQEMFLYMHRQGRILERNGQVIGMAKSITYSKFTPPWIRLNLAVRVETAATDDTGIEGFSETFTLNRASVTNLRKERNTQGYRRLRFILAAFHSQEPEAVKPLLKYLLGIVPSDRAQLRRKPKKI